MQEFAISVNKFLEFNEYKVLDNKGIISEEYSVFNKTQNINSDFDKAIKQLKK